MIFWKFITGCVQVQEHVMEAASDRALFEQLPDKKGFGINWPLKLLPLFSEKESHITIY